MIRHIVLWKLAAADEATKRADAATMAQALSSLPPLIPQIKALSVGPNVAYPASNWDFALQIDFANLVDLEAYQVHPEHVKVVEIVKARVSERAAVDFELASVGSQL